MYIYIYKNNMDPIGPKGLGPWAQGPRGLGPNKNKVVPRRTKTYQENNKMKQKYEDVPTKQPKPLLLALYAQLFVSRDFGRPQT